MALFNRAAPAPSTADTPLPEIPFRPHGDRLVIESLKGEERYGEGLLVKPDVGDARPNRARVVAVSPTLSVPGVKRGSIIWVSSYSGIPVEVRGYHLEVLRGDDVLGVEE